MGLKLAHIFSAGEVIVDGDLRRRFVDLLDKGLGKILVTLATPQSLRPDDSERVTGREMAEWMVSAGGFFPKLAQVLSVRSELVPSVEVRELLSQVQACVCVCVRVRVCVCLQVYMF
jgi:predicted unusual protein kinase regulating ubiquinone biosynthesis (AarF/ABC1/UbiB family)